MAKINPFEPSSPVHPGMFVGRLEEVERIEECLVQTRAGRPANFMVIGERGIGKTSLLKYVRWVAEGSIPLNDTKLKFLVVETDIEKSTSQTALVRKIEMGLRRKLSEHEKLRETWGKVWQFLQRVEVGGTRIAAKETKKHEDTMAEEFSYALADIAGRICSRSRHEIDSQNDQDGLDGILIVFDEADNGPKELDLGAFLKLLTERLQRHGCNRVMFGLAGLLGLRKTLHSSHPSSLRIFQDIVLDRLCDSDVTTVIDRCMSKANEENSAITSIDEDAKRMLVLLSEGYPHFIQQFGFSAFAFDTDGTITNEDVLDGATGKNGAISYIGNHYYRIDFYEKIRKESYRQVLRIMAKYNSEWVSKAEIKKAFRGKEATLNSAIKALRDRNIIVSKEGERGKYRLGSRAFAMWIKYYTTDPREFSSLFSRAALAGDN